MGLKGAFIPINATDRDERTPRPFEAAGVGAASLLAPAYPRPPGQSPSPGRVRSPAGSGCSSREARSVDATFRQGCALTCVQELSLLLPGESSCTT